MGLITGVAFVICLGKITARLTALCLRVVVKSEYLTRFIFLSLLQCVSDEKKGLHSVAGAAFARTARGGISV